MLATVLVPLVVFGFGLISAQPADAARGGRMGGGSFRAIKTTNYYLFNSRNHLQRW